MKKQVLYIVLLTLTYRLDGYAMGLGDMKVGSFLNQPFNAEVELIDVGNVPISGIKVSVASMEDYERMGLERTYSVNLLSFYIEKNAQGNPIIKVRSVERIPDPYMQVLVDLAWAEGQVYRSYTVLLDPPNYRLSLVKKQRHNVVKHQYASDGSSNQVVAAQGADPSKVEGIASHRPKVTYGPTGANETIWQIAQRYKSEEILLQQMILAILGKNKEAFIEGNLNGLKEGSLLNIPSASLAQRVPAALAKLEVLAQDKAWQSRTPIEHALLPPYINSIAASTRETVGHSLETPVSMLPKIPDFAGFKPASIKSQTSPFGSSLLSMVETVSSPFYKENPSQKIQTVNPSKPSAASLMPSNDAIREANAMLLEQLHVLQKDNKRLQRQLTKREKEFQKLQEKMNQILVRQGFAGQAVGAEQDVVAVNGVSYRWTLAFILILLLAGGGLFLLWYRIRSRFEESPPTIDATPAKEENDVGIGASDEVQNTDSIQETMLPLIEEKALPIQERAVTPEDERDVPHIDEKPENIDTNDAWIIEEKQAAIDDVIEPTIEAPSAAKEPEASAVEDDHLLEFEPVTPPSDLVEPVKESQQEEDPNALDFITSTDEVSAPIEAKQVPEEDTESPIKSKIALNTLLDLAKTYVSMDDIEAAKQSLQEVIESGNEAQKKEASQLLEDLDKKS